MVGPPWFDDRTASCHEFNKELGSCSLRTPVTLIWECSSRRVKRSTVEVERVHRAPPFPHDHHVGDRLWKTDWRRRVAEDTR